MPISREEFDRRRIDLDVPIADLLAADPDLAFTAGEVGQLLEEHSGKNFPLEHVEEALEFLASQERLEVSAFRVGGI